MSEYDDVTVQSTELKDDEKLMAMLIYLTSIFTTFVGPLIIWLIKKDESEFVDFHGREYFNFLISYCIYGFIAGISLIILVGFILIPAVSIAYFVFQIMACVKAYGGKKWKIPLVIRFIK